MQKLLREYLDELNRKQKRRRKTVIAVVLAAIMLVSGVIWNLTQYGIAMTDEPKCGMEEHTHSDSCYTNVLVCGREESEGHTHTDACYQTVSELICGQEESEEHTHSEACYQTVSELICGQEESEGHTHTDACYEKQLSCGKEEHTHSEACYIDTTADVEDASIWNAQYADTKWKDAWGEDLVIAAKKQIGYKESTDNYTVATDGSHKGYTRYGQFAGDVYADWDAAFVNFCMHYAGLEDTGLFPKETETAKWYDRFAQGANKDYLTKPAEYEPKVGDVVFLKTEKGETDRQMGIISSYNKEQNEIKVIEGNVDNEVKEQKYSTGDSQIFAYIKVTELEKVFKGTAEEPEAAETEDSRFMQEAETENYIVTVRYGRDAELHKGAKLKVIEYTPDSEEYKEKAAEMENPPEWVLDIGFYVGKKEVEPQAEVSVTVKSKTADAVEAEEDDTKYEYNILHYGEEGTEQVGEVSQSEENGNTVTTFTTNSFSPFMMEKKPIQTYEDTIKPEPAEESILRKDDIQYLKEQLNNEWQIVDKGYNYNKENFEEGVNDPIMTGNRPVDKTQTGDEPVRLQKNVIPTNVENEFLVYLSVDTKASLESYFATNPFLATTSNNFHDNQIGQYVPAMTGNKDNATALVERGAPNPDPNTFNFQMNVTINAGGVSLKKTLWVQQANNITLYLRVNNGYILTGVGVNRNNKENPIDISDDVVEEILKDMAARTPINSVTDKMGDYIEFLEVVKPETAQTSYNKDTRELTWTLGEEAVKQRPVIEGQEGDFWALNVAELVYRVRLDVTKDGFNSCAQYLEPDNRASSPQYKVNEYARLDYIERTTVNGTTTETPEDTLFPIPYVRGLLYDVTFKKVGTNGLSGCEPWPLEGAVFTLTGRSGRDNYPGINDYPINVSENATSDEDGTVTFRGVPWSANYTITETKAPEGYGKIESSIAEITLCHTMDRIRTESERELEVVDRCADMVYKWLKASSDDEKVLDNGVLTVKNIAKDDFTFEKVWNDREGVLQKRPPSLTVTLVPTQVNEATQDGEPGTEMSENEAKKYTKEVTVNVSLKNGQWIYTWPDLPTRTNNNNPIRWIVKEINAEGDSTVPEGYVIADQWYKEIRPEGSSGEGELSPDAGKEESKYDYSYYYIENRLKDEWQIVKKSSSEGGSAIKLEGAEFTLKAVPPELEETVKIQSLTGKSDSNGIIRWYDKNGEILTGNISGLDGTYELKETKAPLGYRVSADVWKVTFDNGFLTKVMLGNREIGYDKEESSYNEETGLHTYVYVFENEALYSLPEAGGPGIYWYIFSGILLMAAAMLMLYKNKYKGVLKS